MIKGTHAGTLVLIAAASILALPGCSGQNGADQAGAPAEETKVMATASATLAPTRGNVASGSVTFTQTPEGVHIFAQVSGLHPGDHGFHVHEFGDCSSGDGVSAGGHFNPTGMPHAGPDAEQRHLGDLGNIIVDEGGNGMLERVDPDISLTDPATTIVGRAVIVHENADDMSTQPSGAAGARIACGVITLSP